MRGDCLISLQLMLPTASMVKMQHITSILIIKLGDVDKISFSISQLIFDMDDHPRGV
jgi:hypothetical protein